MSHTSSMWLSAYEGILDEYIANVGKHGEDRAREIAAQSLKSLGFDHSEITEELEALAA